MQGTSSKPKLADVRLTCYNKCVYEPSEDSFAIADAIAASLSDIKDAPPRLCLEVGGGSGYVICSVALMLRQAGICPHCLVTDLSTAATAACKETAKAHEINNLDVLRMDLLTALLPRLQGKVDILVFNPPYVPTPPEEVPSSQWAYDAGGCAINAAWAGGDRGREVVDRLLPMVHQILSETGRFFLVTVQENDHEEILAQLAGDGLHGRVALEQAADEELLRILEFSKAPFGSGGAGGTAP